jgi:DNA-binding CsgD family transcriptional regulator
MTAKFNYYFRRLDSGVDVVRQKSKHFCEAMELSAFAYVRVYHDGRVGWVTSDADHDRLLFDSGFIAKDPLIDTAKALKKGCYLWFHDREFPGSENFYKLRTKNFNIDHGMVMVNHQKEYLETTCFSGLLKRRPLYNLFTKEKGLFKAFTEHFKQVLNPRLKSLLEEGITMDDIRGISPLPSPAELSSERRAALISACGLANLLRLSARERECLSLFHQALTFEEIAQSLNLSPRTIEHYMGSIKNKLDIHTRSELQLAAEKLIELGLTAG